MYNRSAAVPSPCVRVCKLDRDDLCTGCGRLLDEIARWARMSDDERRVTAEKARERLASGAATS